MLSITTLTLKTDQPTAEIGLYKDGQQLTYFTWAAHRQLAETIHQKIKEVLDGQDLTLENLKGIVVYQGPGSFTGLRIGISVANALSSGLNVPISGTTGEDWITQGLEKLKANPKKPIIPEYGAEPHITQQKK